MKLRTVVESVVCDVCKADAAIHGRDQLVSLGCRRISIDLCDTHLADITAVFDTWAVAGREVARTRSRSTVAADWEYLESLGFKRHRGRKSAGERAALAARR
jgi:hypothetical protein